MKKYILIGATTLLASSAFANDVEVKLNGSADFQAGFRHQKNVGNTKVTGNVKNHGFYNQTGVRVNVSGKSCEDFKYGAVLTLKTTSASKYMSNNGTYMFAESNSGRLELGSNLGASHNMSVSAYDIASATGDDFTRYASLNPSEYYLGGKDDYGLVYSGIGNSNEGNQEGYRKISYYTPEFSGLQLGVTYAPDVYNIGDGKLSNQVGASTLADQNSNKITATLGLKNLVSAGVTYKHTISDGFDVKLGAGYETARSNAKLTDGSKLQLKDHRLYNVGAVISYGNWAVAGSYADAGKSQTNDKYYFGKKRNKLYTAGLAYNQGPVGVSLTYLGNNKYNNKLEAYTLGTSYNLAPGFVPYAEVTSYKFKNKGYDLGANAGDAVTKVNKKYDGQVYIIGTKISF